MLQDGGQQITNDRYINNSTAPTKKEDNNKHLDYTTFKKQSYLGLLVW